MTTCPACSASIPPGSRYCPGCGAAVHTDDSATLTSPGLYADPQATSAAPSPVGSLGSSPGSAASRPGPRPGPPSAGSHTAKLTAATWATGVETDELFVAGAILADRYRILGRLGRGGMGQVFRADDLRVGQPVALKFLPRSMSENAVWLDRFRGEVRIARQVAHPNVCRVYDLGEVDTPHGERVFLSMEYIDGEDMASLLRRIGRLPTDKAVQVARQIGAGLAAAHAQGVIHRDLKPANIMLDGRGQVRIMDFGIAGIADRIDAADVRSGTPAYMAPEQLAGREVTFKSDLYSFGLVLYELFTGHRAFEEAAALPSTRTSDSRTAADISRPSSHNPHIDPAVERLILRCLQDDPAARPPSAMAVIAALPGGDPLLAALEAGETPSPELVAAAGERAALRPSRIAALALPALALLIIAAILATRHSVLHDVELPKPPAVLKDRAIQIAAELGYAQQPADSAWGLFTAGVRYHPGTGKVGDRAWYESLRRERPRPILFWYRTSPAPLTPLRASAGVSPTDPPRTTPGMTYFVLDPQGRLESFSAVTERIVPAEAASPGPAGPAPLPGDLSAVHRKLFELAGLDPDRFTPVDPRRTPATYADHRAAWEGDYTDSPGRRVRVETATYRGQPIFFTLVPPWELEPDTPEPPPGWVLVAIRSGLTLAIVASLAIAAWQARRNVRLGRGDQSGARTLGWIIFLIMFLGWLPDAAHRSDLQAEFDLILNGLAMPLLIGWLAWMLYLAIEPFVRRRDPVMLVSWTRLLAGGTRDPIVGRDVLIGLLGGLGCAALRLAARELSVQMGWTLTTPVWPGMEALTGPLGAAGVILSIAVTTVLNGMLVVFLFVSLLLLVRNKWIAGGIVGFLAAAVISDATRAESGWLRVAISVAAGLGLITCLARFGLLAMLVALLSAGIFNRLPASADPTAWAGQGGWVGLAVLGLLITWAAWAAGGGRWGAPHAKLNT